MRMTKLQILFCTSSCQNNFIKMHNIISNVSDNNEGKLLDTEIKSYCLWAFDLKSRVKHSKMTVCYIV